MNEYLMDKIATKFDRDAFKWGKYKTSVDYSKQYLEKRGMQTLSPSNFKPFETFLSKLHLKL